MHLFDTHTHFDVADFDEDRQQLALEAKEVGVDALVLIGFHSHVLMSWCRPSSVKKGKMCLLLICSNQAYTHLY